MIIVQRLSETLDSKFTELLSFSEATFLFGYSLVDSYQVKAIAKKENDIISVKFLRSAKDFTPIDDLAIPKIAMLRSLRWEIQHVYQSADIPATPNYCWCGFHDVQHTPSDACNEATPEDRESFCSRMKATETCLHRVGLCSNPSNCDCSQTSILNL